MHNRTASLPLRVWACLSSSLHITAARSSGCVQRVGVVYQALPPPLIDGVVKPAKPGGYRDSGADIAFALKYGKSDDDDVEVITPIASPDASEELDWVWPDTPEGISAAIRAGVTTIWANTTLYANHPLVEAHAKGYCRIVGAKPAAVDAFEDKFVANHKFRACGVMNIANSVLFSGGCVPLPLPLVVKPVRGRGSEGVSLVTTVREFTAAVASLLHAPDRRYGDRVIVEEYLDGEELTVTVMPPGRYAINGDLVHRSSYWSLPPVSRFHHVNGIAPYNGSVPIVTNSSVLTGPDACVPSILRAISDCEAVGGLIGSPMPIRVDCRQCTRSSAFKLFDVNLKPNMTGPGRPGRHDQDSLTLLAARAIGWDYPALLKHFTPRGDYNS